MSQMRKSTAELSNGYQYAFRLLRILNGLTVVDQATASMPYILNQT